MFRVSVTAISVVIAVLALLSVNVLAHPAWGIVVDKQGQVYVSDLDTVWKIDTQGRQSVFRAGISGRHIHELTIDEAGDIYGEDLSYEPSTQKYTSAIWKMTLAGVFSYILEPTSNPPKGMSIWRDRRGNTYTVVQTDDSARDFLILKRTPGGDVTTLVSSQKAVNQFSQVVLYSLGGITFGADGSLYLTDRTNIQKATTDGIVTTLARNIPAETSSNNQN